MAKLIKITDDCIAALVKDFKDALSGLVMADGKVSFTKTFNAIDRKATLNFTEIAWHKMQSLVREFDKEVAWHGIAKRSDDEEDTYLITDILVYPQEVTGATVNTDQQEYEQWLMELDDDTFNNLRMQGHSHVNMGTTPSSVDTTHQREILDRLDDDMFYIFLIWNKKNEKTIKIYDFKKNICFETADVDINVIEEENGIQAFIKEAKALVKDKVTTPYSYGNNSGNSGYSGSSYSGSGYSGHKSGYYSGGWDDDGWYGDKYYSSKKYEDEKSTTLTTVKDDSKKTNNKSKKGHRKGHKKDRF